MDVNVGPLARYGFADYLSGAHLIRNAVVTLSNAQLQSLHATPITVLPAPGANLVALPVAGPSLIQTDFSAGAYNEQSWFKIGWSDGAGANSALVENDNGVTNVAEKHIILMAPGGGIPTLATASNGALVVALNAALTGGNAANTAVVALAYMLFNVSTGAFV